MLLWLMSLPAPDPLAGQGCSGASRGPRRWGWYTRPEHLGNRIWGRCMKYTHLENRQCRVKFSCILGFQSIKLTGFYLAEIRMKAPTAVRGGQRGWKRVGWYLTRPRPGTQCEKGTMQLQICRGSGWVDGGQLKVGVNLLMHQHATGLLCIHTNPQVINLRIQF